MNAEPVVENGSGVVEAGEERGQGAPRLRDTCGRGVCPRIVPGSQLITPPMPCSGTALRCVSCYLLLMMIPNSSVSKSLSTWLNEKVWTEQGRFVSKILVYMGRGVFFVRGAFRWRQEEEGIL